MKPLTLKQLREQQAVSEASRPAEVPVTTAPAESSPVNPQSSSVIPTGIDTGGRGFCLIFPATFNTSKEIPPAWKLEFWTAPSPWCRVEGQPDHPDFAANLAKI